MVTGSGNGHRQRSLGRSWESLRKSFRRKQVSSVKADDSEFMVINPLVQGQEDGLDQKSHEVVQHRRRSSLKDRLVKMVHDHHKPKIATLTAVPEVLGYYEKGTVSYLRNLVSGVRTSVRVKKQRKQHVETVVKIGESLKTRTLTRKSRSALNELKQLPLETARRWVKQELCLFRDDEAFISTLTLHLHSVPLKDKERFLFGCETLIEKLCSVHEQFGSRFDLIHATFKPFLARSDIERVIFSVCRCPACARDRGFDNLPTIYMGDFSLQVIEEQRKKRKN